MRKLILVCLLPLVLAGPAPAGAQEADSADIEITDLVKFIPRGMSDCNRSNWSYDFSACETEIKIRHQMPVALIEVYREPGDGILWGTNRSVDYDNPDPDSIPSTGLRSDPSGASKLQSFEVRIWGFDDDLRQMLTLGASTCIWCSQEDAEGDPPSQSNFDSGLEYVGHALGQNFGCSTLASVADQVELGDMFGDMMEESPLELIYTSEVDHHNWRRGCRDLGRGAAYGVQAALSCGLEGVGDGVSSMGDASSQAAEQLLGMFSDGDVSEGESAVGASVETVSDLFYSAADSVDAGDVCISAQWGPMYPRTGTTRGLEEPFAAAVAAYRAMHVAWTEVGSTDLRVNKRAVLQQFAPEVSRRCVEIGQGQDSLMNFDADEAFGVEGERRSMEDTVHDRGYAGQAEEDNAFQHSESGRYAFIYWSEVTCCKPWDDFWDCYCQYFSCDSGDNDNDGGFEEMDPDEFMEALEFFDDISDMMDGGLEGYIEDEIDIDFDWGDWGG